MRLALLRAFTIPVLVATTLAAPSTFAQTDATVRAPTDATVRVQADATVRTRARAAFERAERASAALRFAEAVSAYDEVLATDPSAPFAAIARTRRAWIAARAEASYAPLARLEGVRRDPVKSRDVRAIEALERDAAAFPPGPVRAEARLVVADAWLHSLREPARAEAPLAAILDDASADTLTRAIAYSQLVRMHEASGDLERAASVAEAHPDLVPSLRDEVRRLVRREKLRRAATVIVLSLGLLGLVSAARLARTHELRDLPRAIVRPVSVAFALYVGGAGAVLASLHGSGDPRPFLWLGLALLALDVIARAARLASPERRPALRVLVACACVCGVFAAAFLVLDLTDPAYLESFGL